jgi:hypothetical protein
MNNEQTIAQRNICTNKYRKSGVYSESEVFRFCCWAYLVAFFILPDWFGFYLGMLFSAKRIFLLFCYFMIFVNKKRQRVFWQDIKSCKILNIIIGLYMFVRLYTAVLRVDINTFAGEFLDGVLVFYLFVHMLKHEITLEQLQKLMLITLAILCIEGIFEYITGINLFSYLDTTNQFISGGNSRNGNNRIQANCRHAIHLGIYVSILFLFSCVDLKRNKLYLFNHPVLFILSLITIYCTGSRAPLGIFLLCIVLVVLFSRCNECIKSFFFLFYMVLALAIFTICVYNTEIGRNIMLSLTSMIDAVFDTEFAFQYGGTMNLIWSSEYRDVLLTVFQFDRLESILGQGVSANFLYWNAETGTLIRSIDNSYVLAYIQLAYPGMAVLILWILAFWGCALKGIIRQRDKLFTCILIIGICYFINIWYVAQMGTFMYMWMFLAISYTQGNGKRL